MHAPRFKSNKPDANTHGVGVIVFKKPLIQIDSTTYTADSVRFAQSVAQGNQAITFPVYQIKYADLMTYLNSKGCSLTGGLRIYYALPAGTTANFILAVTPNNGNVESTTAYALPTDLPNNTQTLANAKSYVANFENTIKINGNAMTAANYKAEWFSAAELQLFYQQNAAVHGTCTFNIKFGSDGTNIFPVIYLTDAQGNRILSNIKSANKGAYYNQALNTGYPCPIMCGNL
jgi:hypothetical protein